MIFQLASKQANWQDAELGGDNEKGLIALKLKLFLENIKPEYSKRLRVWAPRSY